MNSKQIGNLTEFKAMLAFLQLGYNVLTPYGDCERYDFVVDLKEKGFIRIQCKTSHSKDNGNTFSFSGRSCNRKDGKIVHHHYTNDEIDFFVTIFNNKCYLIPVSECKADKKLRLIPPLNGISDRINWAKDYELERIINNIN